MTENILELEGKIIEALKNVFDPEIPVNIYDLGLIYDIDVDDNKNVNIDMTLTAPNCPMVDDMLSDIYIKVGAISEVNKVDVKLTFDPPWDQSMLSDEAKLELGLL
ncbi:iron-sulfur cluster assembly protein [Bacteroidota bacterium]